MKAWPQYLIGFGAGLLSGVIGTCVTLVLLINAHLR